MYFFFTAQNLIHDLICCLWKKPIRHDEYFGTYTYALLYS